MADPREIIFTSGATESNNVAIKVNNYGNTIFAMVTLISFSSNYMMKVYLIAVVIVSTNGDVLE